MLNEVMFNMLKKSISVNVNFLVNKNFICFLKKLQKINKQTEQNKMKKKAPMGT